MAKRAETMTGAWVTRLGRGLLGLGLVAAVLACASPAPPQPSAASRPAPPAAPQVATSAAPESSSGPAPSAAPAPLVSVRFPYSAVSVVIMPLWIAREGGYFTQEGVDAEVDFISTGPTMTQAMLAGEVAMAFSGLEAAVSATLAGADATILAVGTDRFLFRVYGVPGVRAIEDLRGKRIGVTRIGTATDVLARLLLQRAGLEPERDTAIVQVGGVPEILAAMQAGAVDAGVVSPPTMFGAEDAGYVRLADTTELDIPFHQAVVMTTRRYVAEQPDTARRVMRAFLRGVARFKQDKAFAKQVLAQYTKSDDDAVLEQSWELENRILQQVPYPREAAIQLALDQARAANP